MQKQQNSVKTWKKHIPYPVKINYHKHYRTLYGALENSIVFYFTSDWFLGIGGWVRKHINEHDVNLTCECVGMKYKINILSLTSN